MWHALLGTGKLIGVVVVSTAPTIVLFHRLYGAKGNNTELVGIEGLSVRLHGAEGNTTELVEGS